MFVYSVKTSKAKAAALIAAIAVITAAIVFVVGRNGKPAAEDSVVNHNARNAAERAAFLSQFGWKISEDPIEVSEVIIPEDFDAGYLEYAEMNKAQGFELEPYKGVRAKRWTYEVLNYPGLEEKSGCVQANLLVYDGRVIGGDICSTEQKGFIRGFDFPAVPAPTAPAETLGVTFITQSVSEQESS